MFIVLFPECTKKESTLFFTGIFDEIAEQNQEHWSALAPLPMEVVLSAGQKAKDEQRAGRFSVHLKHIFTEPLYNNDFFGFIYFVELIFFLHFCSVDQRKM